MPVPAKRLARLPKLGSLVDDEEVTQEQLDEAVAMMAAEAPPPPRAERRARGRRLGSQGVTGDQETDSRAGASLGSVLGGALGGAPGAVIGALSNPDVASFAGGVADQFTGSHVDELGGAIGALIGGEGPMNQATQRFGRALGGEDVAGLGEATLQLQDSPGRQIGDTLATGIDPADYENYREQARGGLEAMQEEAPGSFGAGQAVGGLMQAGLLPNLPGLRGGTGWGAGLARTALGAGEGAILGAFQGEGASEAEDVEGMLADAGTGAGIGAAFGGAGQGLGEAIGGFGRTLIRQAPVQRATALGLNPREIERVIGSTPEDLAEWHRNIQQVPGATGMRTAAEAAPDLARQRERVGGQIQDMLRLADEVPSPPPIVPQAPPPYRASPETIEMARMIGRAMDASDSRRAGTAVARPRPRVDPLGPTQRPGLIPREEIRDAVAPEATRALRSRLPAMRQAGERAMEQAEGIASAPASFRDLQDVSNDIGRMVGYESRQGGSAQMADMLRTMGRGVRRAQEEAITRGATALPPEAGEQLRGLRSQFAGLEPVVQAAQSRAIRDDASPLLGLGGQINAGQGPQGMAFAAGWRALQNRLPAVRASAGEALQRALSERPDALSGTLGPYLQPLANAARRGPAAYAATLFAMRSSSPEARAAIDRAETEASAPESLSTDEAAPAMLNAGIARGQEAATTAFSNFADGGPLTPDDRAFLIQNGFTEEELQEAGL